MRDWLRRRVRRAVPCLILGTLWVCAWSRAFRRERLAFRAIDRVGRRRPRADSPWRQQFYRAVQESLRCEFLHFRFLLGWRYAAHSKRVLRYLSAFSLGSLFAASGFTLASGRGESSRRPSRSPMQVLRFRFLPGRLYVIHFKILVRYLLFFSLGSFFAANEFTLASVWARALLGLVGHRCKFCVFIFCSVGSM